MEWECCIKSPEQGAKEGAEFIQNISSKQRIKLMILQVQNWMKKKLKSILNLKSATH